MHLTLMEEGPKLVKQPQWMLKLQILKVVKNKVTKLLQGCIIDDYKKTTRKRS